jgi:hypothetical protein
MASVYGSAHLTIAATRSPNHDCGCFSELNPQFQTHAVSVTAASGGELTLSFRKILPHSAHMAHSQEHAEEFPLLERGWVYQQRLLSPRVLHFQNNELTWECGQSSECECEERADHPIFMGIKHPKEEHARVLESPSFAALVNCWHQLVQEFSRLKLSFTKDKLPALSGLAKQMSHCREDYQYIVGMWDYTILIDMLWIAQDDQGRRPEEWRGPSWSWVSTTSPVKYAPGLVYALIETYPGVVDSNVRVSSSHNRFGPVTHPTLFKLRGTVFKSGALHFINEDDPPEYSRRAERYGISVNGSLIGAFHADYNLKATVGGDGKVLADGTSIELLLMAKTDNWNICLVLVTYFSAPEYFIAHNFEDDTMIDIRARIGLLQVQHHLSTVDPIRQDLQTSEEDVLLM